MIRYDVRTGIRKIKTKTALVISGFGLGAAGLAVAVAIPSISHADSAAANFEAPTYSLGDINGQDGWIKTGNYDVNVVSNTYSIPSFGAQTLQISDARTSGSFGDQTFSKPLINEAGETDAQNNGLSGGVRQPYFEAQFDLASALSTLQPGMHVSVSPDRGDGARMSYLRFEDQTDGIHVFFDDVQGTSNPANFVETDIATISRAPHTIKFSMAFLEGPSNDVVRIYIDGNLVHTGTSWENYYRYDSESSTGNNSRTVDSLLFRESGNANPADTGNGFLVDNVSLMSGAIPDNTFEAAPAVAARLLHDAGKSPSYGKGKTSGNYISDVAKHMGPGTDFDSVKKNNPAAYECAVAKFLNNETPSAGVTSSSPCYQLVQTLVVNSSAEQGTDVSSSLPSGNYRFDVSGTWQNRGFESVDADYTSPDGWNTHFAGPTPINQWDERLLDLQINKSTFVDWGTYSSGHTYSYNYTGTPTNFRIFDGDPTTNTTNPGWYGDNVGSLTVNIYKQL